MPTPLLARKSPRTLVVISAPRHYLWQSKLWSYGPYAKEIDLWAGLFEEVRIAGPWRREQPPADAVPFTAANVVPASVLETGSDRVFGKLWQILVLPVLALQIALHIRSADAVHIRGPANLSLIASVIAPLLGRPMCAKYAGQWRSYPTERKLVALQRRLFKRWFRGPVTVYGKLDNDPPHVVDFFTSMLGQAQIDSALEATKDHQFHSPLRIVFSGRLYRGKGVLELIEAIALVQIKYPVELRLVGDGPLREAALHLIEKHELSQHIGLLGAMSHHQSLQQFAWGDVMVLASQHEGWPKVLTEAMIHHCLCIAPDAGIMGRMIAGRGCVLDGLSAEAIARALEDVLDHRSDYQALLPDAAQWASNYSMEGLQAAIGDVLEEHWSTGLAVALPGTVPQ